MLLRLIILFLLAYIVFSALKAYLRSRKNKSAHREADPTLGEEMVLDPQCKSYVPKRDAVLQAGHYFCSQECARLFLSR